MTATTSTSITWTWDAVEGVVGYQGEFSPDSTFTNVSSPFLILAPVTSQTVSNLPGNTRGYFRVRSSAADLTFSEWTEGVSGTTDAPPAATALAAPSGLSAGNAQDDSITLSWNEVDDAESYEVEQRLDGAGGNWRDADCGGTGSNEVDDTSCVAEGLDEGTDYEFRVRGIPAANDDAHANGAWAQTDGSTTGRQATTVSGGMGDLNVTWESDANSITFSWDPMSGIEYEWKVLETYSDDENPCEDQTFDTGMGTEFSHEVTGLTFSTPAQRVRGLCVRVMDDDLNDDEKGTSFAWGALTPDAPTPGAAVDEDGVTESMSWSAITLIPDFEWELRLVEDQGRDDGSLTDTSSASDIQKECAAGDHVDNGEADLLLTVGHTVDSGIVHYAGYALCLQYSNTAGSSDWAASDEIYSTPGQPPSPTHQSGRTVTVRDANDVRQTEMHTWTVATRDADTTLPREADEYEAKIITYPQYFDDSGTRRATTHPGRDDCDLTGSNVGGQSQWTFAAVSLTTADNTLDGFEFSSIALTVPDNTQENTLVRVCVRATEVSKAGTDRDGPWRIGGAVTITKNPAP
ncbi:MAG: fibronectin type III domain-containing protein [Acidobacteriota bacterium]|nr:fibronectin type III domain-containing protein [Acidobacteriota bacterium]